METSSIISLKPIGYLKSVFHFKNGTPRQSSLCQAARGVLTIDKSVFNNPEHSLDGLQEFSHAWVIFVFHKNNNAYSKAKVKPPRLNGRKVGVFSTRSPYRPNSIGLSLAKIDLIQGSSIHLSGIDILDGTPILDIKPYIPEYDKPFSIDDFLERYPFPYEMEDSKKPLNVESEMNSGSTIENVKKTVLNKDDECNTRETSNSDLVSRSPCQSWITTSHYDVDKTTRIKSIRPEEEVKGEDAATDSWSSAQDVATGFYSLSAALDKAGIEISSKSKSRPSNSRNDILCNNENEEEANEEPVLSKKQSNFPDMFSSYSDDKSDDQFLDFLVGDALAKAASQLTLSDGGSCQNADSLITHTKLSEGEECQNLPSVLLPNKVKMYKSKGNKRRKHPSLGQSQSTSRKETSDDHGKKERESNKSDRKENKSTVTALWLSNPPVNKVKVSFTPDAIEQLQAFSKDSYDERFKLQMLKDPEEARIAITNILHEEPRSVYRRQHCQDSLYYFAFDVLHITCWFDEEAAQVVRIKPVKDIPILNTRDKIF